MKLSVFLSIVAVFCILQISEAQSKKKLYYSKHWELTTQDSAYYYRVCTLDTVKYQFIGEVTDYLVNEQLMMTGSYSNGQKNGEFILYHPNGQIESQGVFKDDKRFGVWKYYFSNGKIQREVSFTKDDFFVNKLYDANENSLIKDGSGNWVYRYDWENLPYKLIVMGRFVDGKKEGDWRCLTSNGELLYIENFIANKFQSGTLFENGKKVNYEEEFRNKFLTPYKFEVTEKLLYSKSVTKTDYPFLGFLSPHPIVGADQVYSIVEEQGSYEGGMRAFYELIGKHIKYPNQAKRMNIQGKVLVEVVINIDGSLSDIKAIKGIGGGCDEEAVRVVALSNAWIPGKHNGVAVRTRFVVPINFRLQ